MSKLQELLCDLWPRQPRREQSKVEILKLALKELQIHSQELLRSGETLDGKMLSLLEVYGWLVFAASLFLRDFALESSLLSMWVVGIFIAYSLTIVFVWNGQRPRVYATPIPSTWEEMDRRLFQVPEEEALLALISAYITVVEKNFSLNAEKAKLYRILSWSWGILIGIVSPAVFLITLLGGK